MARKLSTWPRKVISGQSLVTVYRTSIEGSNRFQLRWTENGAVQRHTFTDEEKALEQARQIADRLHSGQSGAMTLSTDEAVAYRHALACCGDVPIDAFCRELAEARRRLGDIPLMTAVDDYLARHRGESITVAEAVIKFCAEMDGKPLNPDYLRTTKERLAKVSARFGPRQVRDVLESDIREYLEGLTCGPRMRKNMRDVMAGLWRWCRRDGYLPRDIQTEAERVKSPAIHRHSSILIFTPEEMTKLLASCDESIRPVIAICSFAGVRSDTCGEISRLTWEAVLWDRGENGVIEVTESKTGARRLVPMQPNLRAWLEPYKSKTGKIWTGGRIDHAFRRAALSAGLRWKKNAPRHSFGSYRVAQLKDIPATSLEMGNSPAMVRKHYLEAVHESDAVKWFGITPAHCLPTP